MSGFQPVTFPQTQKRIGDKGPDGPPGAAGAVGAAGAPGAPGAVSITSIDLSEAQMTALNATPVIITPDVDGVIQLVLFAMFEVNKTVAGAVNPSMRVRWRGTATDAIASSTVGLTSAEISYRIRVPVTLQSNQIGVGLRVPIEGLGLQVDFSVNPGAVFRATARVSIAVLSIPAVIS